MGLRVFLAMSVVMAIISLGWAADHYHGKATEWRTAAHSAQTEVNKLSVTITDMQTRQRALAALDKTHVEALNAAESENKTLRRQLAAGTRRMYVQGKCPVSGSGTKTAAVGMGDGTAVELTASAGQDVLDIRAGIISDQQKLKYLQDYIRTECLQ